MLMPEVKLKLPAQVLLGAHFREGFGKSFHCFHSCVSAIKVLNPSAVRMNNIEPSARSSLCCHGHVFI